jgi:hypothetical protein
MEKYLKPKQHYIDLYDKHTIAQCRSWLSHKLDPEHVAEQAKKHGASEEEAKRARMAADHFYVYYHTGERYIQKADTIRKWMERDEARDTLFETATAPEDITCRTCGRLMFVSSKHLNIGSDDEKDTVLFFYDCPLEHIPRRAFYNNGQEFRREPRLCPKCQAPVNEEDKSTKKKFVTLITCPSCDYADTQEIERTAYKEEEPDPDFEKDRAKFCLSDEEGMKFIEGKRNLEELSKIMEKHKEKEKEKDVYDEVAKIKKLKIIELEQLLAPVLEKEGYVKLQFKNPEITKDVIVPFVVYEQRPDREDRASTHDLEKLLRKTLQETNWRLMTDGTSYRLGMIEGRLRGYEREDDLVTLMRQKLKKEVRKETP